MKTPLVDRTGTHLDLGDKVAWASKHASNAVLKIGHIEQINVSVTPSPYSWSGKTYEVIKAQLKVRITRYASYNGHQDTFLARVEQQTTREVGAPDLKEFRFTSLEKV
jgi:hypothetical protein